jgi:Cu(I)/Ag(I) efflux system membrane fusion protein
MSRSVWIAGTLAALAAGAGGYWAGRHGEDFAGISMPAGMQSRITAAHSMLKTEVPLAQPAATPRGPVIYYRDPDGKPFYAPGPQQTPAGRDFIAVAASEDVSFDARRSAPEAKTAPAVEKRILFYRNPMGLPDTSPAPKKDSMGMDYIPVYEGGGEDGSIVTVAAGKLQRTGVRSQAATRQTIVRKVRAAGTVQLDERRISVVSTRSDAFIDNVADVTTGDRVKKGEPLMRLYSAEIAAAGAQYLNDLNAGGRATSGARQRLENLGVPSEVIATVERTRQPPLSIPWSAPRDGIIIERNVVEGMADVSTVWVVAEIPEYDLAAVRVGARADIRVRSLPSRTFGGRVALIYPQVSRDTRTTKARIEIANGDGALLPDMYADVDISSDNGKPVVAVPDSAVIDTGTRQVVIVDTGEGRFEPREVEAGVHGGGLTEIRKGIEAGETVVVAANFLIDAESNLKAALRGMTSAEQTP